MKSPKNAPVSPELAALAKNLLPVGAKITPMLTQWLAAKAKAKNAILLFRMGDFYELFAQDAEIAAPILELALTCRDKKNGDSAVPMAGFPHHSAAQYISKLVGVGQKVAICDQMEDPKASKGIVKRSITRVVTPGTVLEESGLAAREHNFMVAISERDGIFGLSALDLSTGDFFAATAKNDQIIKDEVARLDPAEIVLSEGSSFEFLPKNIRVEWRSLQSQNKYLPKLGEIDNFFRQPTCQSAVVAAELLLDFVEETQSGLPEHIASLRPYTIESHLLLDPTTLRHLDVMGPKGRRKEPGTLLSVLDKTKTAMGGRLLMRTLCMPSCDLGEIESRHEAVGFFLQNPQILDTACTAMRHVYDMERLASRVATNRISPKELGQLRNSLAHLPQMAATLQAAPDLLKLTVSDASEQVFAQLHSALVEDPPFAQKEGGIFNAGFSEELDELVSLARGGRDAIARIENDEREKTGISSLKVKYTRVFGYYIEVTRTHLDKVPDHYKRKQTIATGERYVTEELAVLEAKLASAESKRLVKEAQLFEALRVRVLESLKALQDVSEKIATIDMLASFASVAEEMRYVQPKMLPMGDKRLYIENGRHPVVEQLCAKEGDSFVPNNVTLDAELSQVMLITGPNMGGKSTIMRQAALTQLMAQAGSFVPAERAELSICDRIFTRVGANDDISTARSTFMVEMSETAHILNHATECSLVLLDEIGRGTSTFDGLSIAWSVAEYMHDWVGSRTLFATHYHELTALSKSLSRLVNAHVALKEEGGKITFLYTLVEGAAEQSYGVHVAELAGLPAAVTERAHAVLADLEKRSKASARAEASPHQMDFFAEKKRFEIDKQNEKLAKLGKGLIQEIEAFNVDDMTPLKGLMALGDLQERVKELQGKQ